MDRLERGRIEASWRRFATVLGVLDMSKRRTLDKSKTPVPPQKSNLDRSADSFGKSPTGGRNDKTFIPASPTADRAKERGKATKLAVVMQ